MVHNVKVTTKESGGICSSNGVDRYLAVSPVELKFTQRFQLCLYKLLLHNHTFCPLSQADVVVAWRDECGLNENGMTGLHSSCEHYKCYVSHLGYMKKSHEGIRDTWLEHLQEVLPTHLNSSLLGVHGAHLSILLHVSVQIFLRHIFPTNNPPWTGQ